MQIKQLKTNLIYKPKPSPSSDFFSAPVVFTFSFIRYGPWISRKEAIHLL